MASNFASSVGKTRSGKTVRCGGRLVGTCFAAITQWTAYYLPGEAPSTTKTAYVAAAVAFTVYLVNFFLSFLLPEPNSESLDE